MEVFETRVVAEQFVGFDPVSRRPLEHGATWRAHELGWPVIVDARGPYVLCHSSVCGVGDWLVRIDGIVGITVMSDVAFRSMRDARRRL